MKSKLIVPILLSFSLIVCAEKEPQSKAADNDGPWWDRERVCEIEAEPYPFNFINTYNATAGKQQFSRPITQSERDQYYDFYHDKRDESTLGGKERFNRKRPQPKLTPKELAKKEQIIKVLLDECVALVGPEKNDYLYRLELQNGVFEAPSTENIKDPEWYTRSQPHYLNGRMMKCERAVYPWPPQPLYAAPCAAIYDVSDFEYSTSDIDTPESYEAMYWTVHSAKYVNSPTRAEAKAKRAILEKKYEIIYLNIRAAGLLRYMNNTYYPKSFLREHADQTGLTRYIQQEEKKAGHKLKHDELAKIYFGSYEKWVESLDKYLDQKIIDLKIGA